MARFLLLVAPLKHRLRGVWQAATLELCLHETGPRRDCRPAMIDLERNKPVQETNRNTPLLAARPPRC
jgi:hypothetical protein